MPPALALSMSKKKAFKKVVWAFDPFEGAAETRSAVVSTLALLREKMKVAIQPVFVLSPGSFNLQMSLSQPHVKQYLPSAEKVMESSLKEIHLDGVVQPEVLVQRTDSLRDAVMNFLGYAKSKRADLIVTATQANKGLARLLLGSFTETLILHSKLPVLVVNPTAKVRPIQRILFPTDLSPGSKAFFKMTCELAKELGAEVVLLHAIPHPIAPLFQSGVYLIGGGWIPIPEYMSAAEERARKIADKWKGDATKSGVAVSTYFDAAPGGVRDTILERARELDVGMIAMASQTGTVGTALLGSVSRQIVREAPCPVWIMRKGR